MRVFSAASVLSFDWAWRTSSNYDPGYGVVIDKCEYAK
jgi:hypothetical protein